MTSSAHSLLLQTIVRTVHVFSLRENERIWYDRFFDDTDHVERRDNNE